MHCDRDVWQDCAWNSEQYSRPLTCCDLQSAVALWRAAQAREAHVKLVGSGKYVSSESKTHAKSVAKKYKKGREIRNPGTLKTITIPDRFFCSDTL